MNNDCNWRDSAKCKNLTPLESDQIFFPSSGGKPTQAREYCADCPVVAQCLQEAIELKLDGFIAGTTPKERKVMAEKWHIEVAPLVDSMPPEPIKRRVYRKIQSPILDTVAFLDSILEPTSFR